MNVFEKKKKKRKDQAPSTLLKNIKKDCASFQYLKAVKRLESSQYYRTTYEEKISTYFVRKSLYVILDAICLETQWEKYVAHFMKCYFYQWPVQQRMQPMWCAMQLIKEQLILNRLHIKPLINVCNKTEKECNELIPLTIRYLKSSKQWTLQWNWSRWLLLLRLLPLLTNLRIAPDAHILLTLLHCSIKALLPVYIQGILLSCLLATASFPTLLSQDFSMFSFHFSNELPKRVHHLWIILNEILCLPSSSILDALDLTAYSSIMCVRRLRNKEHIPPFFFCISNSYRVKKNNINTGFSYCKKGIQGSIKSITYFLNEPIFSSYDFNNISFLGSFAHRLSQSLYKNQFSFSQIVSSKFLSTLYESYKWMSLLCIFPLENPSQFLNRAFQYHKGIDKIHKIPYLVAIQQAILCSRERHRHGACLIRSSLENNNSIHIVSKGRNQVIKNPIFVHRPGAVRHAEIACLINSTLFDPLFSTSCPLSFNNPSNVYTIYIVELDDYDIGYCDAQACPLCTTALEKMGVSSQYYSTANGLCYETFPYLPNVKAPTLDFIFQRQAI